MAKLKRKRGESTLGKRKKKSRIRCVADEGPIWPMDDKAADEFCEALCELVRLLRRGVNIFPPKRSK